MYKKGIQLKCEGRCRGKCDCSQQECPVCGLDDETYLNLCWMNCADVPMKHEGPCQPCECDDVD